MGDFKRHRKEAHEASLLVTWNNKRGSAGKLARISLLSNTSKRPSGVRRNLRAATPHVAGTDQALEKVSTPSQNSDNIMRTRSTKQNLVVESPMDCSSCDIALRNQKQWEDDRCFEQGETDGIIQTEMRTSRMQSSHSTLSSYGDDDMEDNPSDQLNSPLRAFTDQLQDDIRLRITPDIDGGQGRSEIEEVSHNSQEGSNLQGEITTPFRQGSSLRYTEPSEVTGKSFQCPNCPMSFSTNRELRQHDELHRLCKREGHSRTSTIRENGDQISMCDRCGLHLEEEPSHKKRKISQTVQEDVDMIHVSNNST